jgi:hypothetical protein
MRGFETQSIFYRTFLVVLTSLRRSRTRKGPINAYLDDVLADVRIILNDLDLHTIPP